VAIRKEKFLMRTLVLILTFVALMSAAPRVDNVLEKMVPPGATALTGVHLDQVKQTEMFRRILPPLLAPLDTLARVSGGFDARRDLQEALYAGTPSGGVLLTRGAFPAKQTQWKELQHRRHGQYDVWISGRLAFCILDATLAAVGDPRAVEAALDEWTSGTHLAAQSLLAKASLVDPQSQLWGVSTDLASLAGDIVPGQNENGFDFAKALRSLGEGWFQADLSSGIRLEIHGVAASEADAANVRSALRGLVGLGRLNVPEGQPELLRIFDGIVVEQKGRSVILRTDMPQNLADKLMGIFGPDGGRQN
jgi:hypothetical protein